jgi:hypothetical protein
MLRSISTTSVAIELDQLLSLSVCSAGYLRTNGSICPGPRRSSTVSARRLPRRKTGQPTHAGAHLVVQGVIFRFASTSATNADGTRPVTRWSRCPASWPRRVPRDMETATDGLRKRVMKVKGH